MNQILSVLVISLSAIFLAACGTMQAYQGSKKSPNEVSVISTGFTLAGGITINRIDGLEMDSGSDKAEVLPGEHSISSSWSTGSFTSRVDTQSFTITTVAGHNYTIKRSDGWEQCDIAWKIVDDVTNEVVAENIKCSFN